MTAPLLRGLPWLGGKSPANKRGMAQWVSELLPHTPSYCEPFFGMGGVFLTKKPSATEWVNDIDGRLMNWWKVIADPKLVERFCLKLETMGQRTEDTHSWALENIDNDDPVEAAAAFTVLIQNNRLKFLNPKAKFTPDFSQRAYPLMPERVLALHQRLYKVYVTNRDAIEVLERCVGKGLSHDTLLVYCDPPYKVNISKQYADLPDYDAMSECFTSVKDPDTTKIAISGYGDEWDHLGWFKTEKLSKTSTSHAYGKSSPGERTECLWTNYEPTRKEI